MTGKIGQASQLIEALAYPAALFGGDGAPRAANVPFHDLLERLLPATGLSPCPSLEELGRAMGIVLPNGGLDGFEFAAPRGYVAQFTLAPLADGWMMSALDITEQRRAERRVERAQKVAIVALADLAEHRDTDTGEHVLRVARLTHEIARHLKTHGHYADQIDDEFMRFVGMASILHDVGKVSVPDAILLKPGRLTPEERAVMECHAADGGVLLRKAERMLAGSLPFRLSADIAISHHERWNGGGYPHGLAGEGIPLAARIAAVADVYDALVSERPYKHAWTSEAALTHMQVQAGKDFDPLVVEALAAVLETRARARTIAWTAKMEVGNTIVDHDHRILLALVNQISLPETKQDPVAVGFILDELLGYTAMHFAREEGLMEKAGYPDLVEHRAIHKAMIAEVQQLQARLEVFTPRLGDDLHRFLANWLMQHILVEDRHYIPYVCAPGAVGVPAAVPPAGGE